MPKTTARITTNDVLGVLRFYQQEHRVIAHQRVRYAIKALERFFAGKKVSQIDIPLCRQYVAHRMGEGAAMSTAARELTTLRAACNHALRWKRINPAHTPTFEIPADLPKREIWLFKDELRKLLDCALESDALEVHAFIKIAYGTGSRRRAIEQLEWNQVDFHRRTITLAKRGEPKSNKKRPVVPIGDLYDFMMELYEKSETGFVLGTDADLLYEFTKVCKAAGLLEVGERGGRPSGRITPHVLRHSRATHLLEDGVSIYAVAKLLGDTPMTVQKTYGHISMGSLEDELSKSSIML